MNNFDSYYPNQYGIFCSLLEFGILKLTKRVCRSGKQVKFYKSRFSERSNANISSLTTEFTRSNFNEVKYSLKISLFNARYLRNLDVIVGAGTNSNYCLVTAVVDAAGLLFTFVLLVKKFVRNLKQVKFE